MEDAPPLETLECRGLEDGPHLLVTGGVHGDEFEPMAAIRRLHSRLPTMSFRGRVTLVPVVNQEAFLLGQRTASDGLDLARTCPGRRDGSVTERLAWSLSRLIESVDYYVDLHSGGRTMQLWPLAGYVLHPDDDVLTKQRTMARAFNLPVVWGTDPRLEGRSLSVARDAGVPAIYAEYLGGGVCSAAGVTAYVDGCLNLMSAVGMIESRSVENRVRFEVEDPRSQSGHLQICLPSPRTGFFEPAVGLGQIVNADDLLGTVCDLGGLEVDSVKCGASGLVLGLRTFSRVIEGDSLGVVLEWPPARPSR